MHIEASGLNKTFRLHTDVTAMRDVSFVVNEGEMLVLLGPSGCGKTTTLRCLAGLERPDSGTIRFGERVVFDGASGIEVAAHRRGVGLVFQTFALWPHMSARHNIAFPLGSSRSLDPRSRWRARADARRQTDELAAMLELTDDLLEKRPSQLSGGQQQRVALGRALVARPGVVLFDEPLSNLDAILREQLRGELRALHRRLGFTGVYVTHDIQEAITLGDRIAVMGRGAVQQIGTPDEVFDSPANVDVGRLLGLRKLAEVHSRGGVWSAEGLRVTGINRAAADVSVNVCSRTDRVHLGEQPVPRALGLGPVTVLDVATVAGVPDVRLQIGPLVRNVVPRSAPADLHPGQSLMLSVEHRDAFAFELDGRALPELFESAARHEAPLPPVDAETSLLHGATPASAS